MSDVWHSNKVLIFSLKHPMIKVRVSILEREWGFFFLWDPICICFCYGKGRKRAYGTVIPSWRMLCTGELEAIQMQWSKQAYISQNNIEPANSCSVSQQPAWLRPTALTPLGIFKIFLGIYWTHKYLSGDCTFLIIVKSFSSACTVLYLVTTSECHHGMLRCGVMNWLQCKTFLRVRKAGSPTLSHYQASFRL